VRRKAIALILSGIFPGLGQLYNRQPVKGAVFVIAGAMLSWLVGRAVSDPLALPTAPIGTNVILLACLLLAIWLWSLLDAWRAAGG
jgi:hypothetical protein